MDLINASSNVLITAHIRPDGDACGCIRAMMGALTPWPGQSRHARLFMSPLSSWYKSIFERQKRRFSAMTSRRNSLWHGFYDDVDLVILLDTDSNGCRFRGLPTGWLFAAKKVLVIDHHITGDKLGTVQLVDTTAAAAGEIVFDLLKFAGWPITADIAQSIFHRPFEQIPAGLSSATRTAGFSVTRLPNSLTRALGPMRFTACCISRFRRHVST